ncbi:MAG: lysine biosynthesis protein LysX [Phycisphaerales bacterium]|nr:MAG: lysine biosynthesis protein LysX [Phycisphaerales bacterium]
MRLAMTFTRLRTEERLLLDAFESLGVRVEPIDLRRVVFDPSSLGEWSRYDAVIDRSVSLTGGLTAVRILEGLGVRCINTAEAIETCADKLRTTIALLRAGVPTPGVRVAIGPESGLEAIESIGYPGVLKPTVGSWGRLVARVNDRDAAEALLEHRDTLGSAQQSVVYAQEHIDKPGRDLRVFVVGGEAIAAIVRTSAHWVTNTARGATAAGLELTDELRELCIRAVAATGADVAAVDVLECPIRGPLVNEINHSMEFRNSITTTGVDIPALVARHSVRIAEASADRAACAHGSTRSDAEVIA